jgi:hypothetical protein
LACAGLDFLVAISLVPVVGFELTTYRLQGDCSTPELNRPIFILLLLRVPDIQDDLLVRQFCV